ncbi:MAG: hypothetical protein QW717_01170 [Candidatus Bathyarchaeia archaeon]
MKCPLCSKEVVKNGYCGLHAMVYKILVKKYAVWKKALGISWKEYLSKIAENPFTGEWAKEMAEYLVKSGETENDT